MILNSNFVMILTRRIFTQSPWEEKISYCRAIRKGSFIAVSGTTSIKNGRVFAPGDAYQQTLCCLAIIEESLQKLGAQRSDILRTRMFVSDISQWELFGKAHGEFFKDCPPATSMLEVKALIDPELLIEIEADAVVDIDNS